MYRIMGKGGGGVYRVKYAFFHCVVFFFFFSLLFTFGVESGRLGGLGVGMSRVGGVGWLWVNSKCHNARTSSIYCFRDCLLYLVRVSF